MTLRKPLLWQFFGAFVVLTMMDFFLTKNYLHYVGLYGEANPLMRGLAEMHGVDAIAYAKLIPLGVFALAMLFAKPKSYSFIYFSLIGLSVVTIPVVMLGIYFNATL